MRAPSSLNCKVKTFKLFDFVTSYISQHLMRDCSGAFSAGIFWGRFYFYYISWTFYMLYICHYFTQNGRKSSIFTLFTNQSQTCLCRVQKPPCRWLGGSRLVSQAEMLLLGEILKFLSLRPRAADRPWLLTAAGPWPWQRRAQAWTGGR